jgi:hypothetical protein
MDAGRRLALRAIGRAAAPLGQRLVSAGTYGPAPDLPAPGAPDSEWLLQSSMVGLAWNLERQLGFVESELAGYIGELSGHAQLRGAPGALEYAYTWYERAEAQLLYAIVRWAKPKQLIELGTGFSTLVSAAACVVNTDDGHPCTFVSVDPGPQLHVPDTVAGLSRIERRRAQQLPLERFSSLDRGDVLFVDTTHTVKRGSEVVHLVLEVLPRLRPGVIVHFHDIFLPFDYPRRWYEQGLFLNEQWMVQAYLADNPSFEVLVAAFALKELAGDRFANSIPAVREAQIGPSAFWLRRVGE